MSSFFFSFSFSLSERRKTKRLLSGESLGIMWDRKGSEGDV